MNHYMKDVDGNTCTMEKNITNQLELAKAEYHTAINKRNDKYYEFKLIKTEEKYKLWELVNSGDVDRMLLVKKYTDECYEFNKILENKAKYYINTLKFNKTQLHRIMLIGPTTLNKILICKANNVKLNSKVRAWKNIMAYEKHSF